MKQRELERSIEDRCVQKIEALGGKAFKLVLAGSRGFPDRTVLLPDGRCWFCEFKRPQTGVVSAQQRKFKFMLNLLGFHVYHVDNDAEFDSILEEWR
jgi:hypothetical protein